MIRWNGETGDPSRYQCIRPAVGSTSAGDRAWQEWQADFEIAEGLWTAQSSVIERQSETLAALADHLGDSTSQGGFWGIINAVFQPVLEEIIQQAIAEAIEHAWGIPDDLAEVIASFFMGLWEGILEALDEFDQGHAQCNALIDENTALLATTISWQNYNLRADTLTRHENIIARLSGNIEKGKTGIWEALDALLKFAGLFTSGEDNDDWVSIFESIESAITNMDSWMQDVYTADAADPQLPVPVPPQLPTLPDKNKKQPSKAIMFYMAKLAIKLFTEWLRRHKEHDPDVAEGLERAFFFTDKDGKKKSILERGLLKEYPTEILALLEVLDQDLALSDATIDFGSFRVNIKGKTIQYG